MTLIGIVDQAETGATVLDNIMLSISNMVYLTMLHADELKFNQKECDLELEKFGKTKLGLKSKLF